MTTLRHSCWLHVILAVPKIVVVVVAAPVACTFAFFSKSNKFCLFCSFGFPTKHSYRKTTILETWRNPYKNFVWSTASGKRKTRTHIYTWTHIHIRTMQSLRCPLRTLMLTVTRNGRHNLNQPQQRSGLTTGTGNGVGAGAGSGAGAGALQKLREWHTAAFSKKFLLFTNVGISLSLSCVGDVLEQHLEIYSGEIERFDKTRTTHMATSGVTVGVICHFWYQMLDKRMPGRSMRVVAKKIILDQLICSPVYISVFFVTLGLLENKDRHEVWEEIKDKAWKLYAAEWTVWPLAQFINFYWIPTHYRIFYDNIISLGYDVLTSKVKHKKP